MINIRKLETELWEAADLLRADSKVTSQEYCMPVLGLIFLRYAYSRFKFVEAEILKNRPVRNGRVLPVEADDFKTKSAIFLPKEARYDYLLYLPDNTDMGQAINHAMELVEAQSAQLKGILPKNYTILQNDLLRELLRIFNNSAFNEMKDDIIGRIYEYFLNKFAPAVASDDGVFFTPKSLVRMIVNIIEPTHTCHAMKIKVNITNISQSIGIPVKVVSCDSENCEVEFPYTPLANKDVLEKELEVTSEQPYGAEVHIAIIYKDVYENLYEMKITFIQHSKFYMSETEVLSDELLPNGCTK